jgi:hypothetical protein
MGRQHRKGNSLNFESLIQWTLIYSLVIWAVTSLIDYIRVNSFFLETLLMGLGITIIIAIIRHKRLGLNLHFINWTLINSLGLYLAGIVLSNLSFNSMIIYFLLFGLIVYLTGRIAIGLHNWNLVTILLLMWLAFFFVSEDMGIMLNIPKETILAPGDGPEQINNYYEGIDSGIDTRQKFHGVWRNKDRDGVINQLSLTGFKLGEFENEYTKFKFEYYVIDDEEVRFEVTEGMPALDGYIKEFIDESGMAIKEYSFEQRGRLIIAGTTWELVSSPTENAYNVKNTGYSFKF